MSRDMSVRVGHGETCVVVTAEGVSYSPDALNDMLTQAVSAFRDVLAEVEGYDIEDDAEIAEADGEA